MSYPLGETAIAGASYCTRNRYRSCAASLKWFRSHPIMSAVLPPSAVVSAIANFDTSTVAFRLSHTMNTSCPNAASFPPNLVFSNR
ncbi:uncharacterized protein MONOS_16160 [Monocercomonoides exilis]|uniref:uncharacterized protein n=1 Tax=Monocercomonoides exilis TaxID=2049356 RepID=UPI003559676D|nr:hypothetical protein MONOS_16160 [Monocercomonoides exilis]|eukprot:MONOS_16160.1-p1 / transcript=MONOS_16160.1 / gene=MONOS_16160 / organism=Monocercomonoides_exilis_PA203 / gene_product=unspecified product / transcript_product=unspecified product / location=Mono_scaffold01533:4476-4733(-) / protein_length=86 / sequence_SO=supercontig / SO=protein_coding / is_pseudo=false